MTDSHHIEFTPFPLLSSKRLILRQLTLNDKNIIFILRSDPVVNKYLNRTPAKTEDDAADFIIRINDNIRKNEAIYWGISLRESTELIGTICLWNISGKLLQAETGFELLPGFQSKGYITEALKEVLNYGFGDMKLNSVLAYVHPENKPSIKVLERSGFVYLNYSSETNEMVYEKTSSK